MKKLLTTIILSVAVLSGCASNQPQKEQVSFVGTIQGVRNYQENTKEPSLGNTAIGGVGGGLLGNQIGSGNGRTLATILGAVSGAVVGSQVGQKTVLVAMQELSVQMPDGRIININVANQGFFSGQKVEIKSNGKTAEIKAI